MRFFGYPLNYGAKRCYQGSQFVGQVQDNKYHTTWTASNDPLTINIDSIGNRMGDARSFSAVFVKCKNTASIAVTGLSEPITIDETYDNTVGPDGFHNILYRQDTATTASQTVQLTFPTGSVVSQILILNEQQDIYIPSDNRFVEFNPTPIHRGKVQHNSLDGVASWSMPLNSGRIKLELPVVVRYRGNDTLYRNLFYFLQENPTFVSAIDWPRHPQWVFICGSELGNPGNYISNYIPNGMDMPFTIIES